MTDPTASATALANALFSSWLYRVTANAADRPNCPVMLHYGEEDRSIPMEDVEKVRKTVDPAMVQVFVYHAGHGFNCDLRSAFHPESARLAVTRPRPTTAALASDVELAREWHQLTLDALADVDAGRAIDHVEIEAWEKSLTQVKRRKPVREER